MEITISAKKMQAGESFTEYANDKVNAKLGRFFGDAGVPTTAKIVLQPMKDDIILELTVKHGSLYFRAEQTAKQKEPALDACTDRIIRQIRKNKSKISKHLRDSRYDDAADELSADDVAEDTGEFNVVRSKKFILHSMSAQEAILQMNLIGHKFFMFLNGDTGKVNVVYKRENSSEYGLLEPTEE